MVQVDVLLGGVLNGRSDKAPPGLEPGWGLDVRSRHRVAQEDGIECAQDLAAIGFGPSDRIGMLEIAIFWIGAVYFQPNL
jgi:hypothetical protein